MFLIIIILFFQCQEKVQVEKIIGIVVNNEGLPISEVELIIADITKTAYSNTKGEFYFEEIPMGDYKISISRNSYINLLINYQVVLDNDVDTLKIVLDKISNKTPIISIETPIINENNEIIVNATIENLNESGEIFSHGFVWSKEPDILSNPNYTNLGIVSPNNITHNFVYTYNAFEQNTNYYIKAYATNSIDKAFSITETFIIEEQQDLISFVLPNNNDIWLNNSYNSIKWLNNYVNLDTYKIDVILYSAGSEQIIETIANQIDNTEEYQWLVSVNNSGYYFLVIELNTFEYGFVKIRSQNFRINI